MVSHAKGRTLIGGFENKVLRRIYERKSEEETTRKSYA
jgi:hypothetical protein